MVCTAPRWYGSLDLRFSARGHQTILERCRHEGPLRVQRPFSEQDGACQVYVLNPPGGTVGGDELVLDASCGPQARALLTAPGASKFYRSGGAPARTEQRLRVAAGGRLEWLPQETIVYDGAVAHAVTRVELERGAQFVGWELTCLGRPACGETFTRGSWSQSFELWKEGCPLWLERTHFDGGDIALQAPWGLAGRPAYGSMAMHPVRDSSIDVAREAVRQLAFDQATSSGWAPADQLWIAFTLLSHADGTRTLVARALGQSAYRAREAFTNVWRALRPLEFGSSAEPPRIWAT